VSTAGWVLSHITFKAIIGRILYLAGKDDDLLYDPGSLVLKELLNDVVTEGTGPNNGEVCVSRHELPVTLSAACVSSGAFGLLYLFFL
jgi:hypothetical protein